MAFEAFGVLVQVSSDDAELFDRVPAFLPPGWSARPADETTTEFGILRDGRITRDGRIVVHEPASSDLLLFRLGTELRHHFALQAPHHIFVHAGVVGIAGRAVLIPGRSFSGKTRLVASLLSAGATYYSDEYAVVDGEGWVHPFAKPLSIRPPDALRGVPTLVPEEQIGTKPLRGGLILVTRYQPGAQWCPVIQSRGKGVLTLLDNTVAVRARPGAALAAACAVAEHSEVIAGDRDEADEIVPAVLEAARRSASPDGR